MRTLSFFPTSLLFAYASADVLPFLNSQSYQNGDWGNYPAQVFLSDKTAVAPVPNILVEAQEGVSLEDYITWAPVGGTGIPQIGPQLLDAETLSLVYQAPTFGPDNFGISVQSCNNTDYLIWWSGTSIEGRSAGMYHIFSTDYENLWNITAIGLEYADGHDLFLTPQCTAVFTAYQPREYDLSDFGVVVRGDKPGWIMETYFQEIDVATNTLLFQWRASDHVDLHDSFWVPGIRGLSQKLQGTRKDDSWDYFHLNSVEKDHRGNYLISVRHYASIMYIDGKTGDVIWTLGGKKNDFNDPSGEATKFAWQHHARWANSNLTSISVFDDRNCRYIKSEDPVSRGILFDLDYMTRSVTARYYKATANAQSFRKGGMNHLPNGNVVLGYGNEPGFTEFTENGTVVYDVRFGPMAGDRETADNYRTLKVNWTGNPTWSPNIATGPFLQDVDRMAVSGASSELPHDTAYFSWNGATKLAKWAILASQNSSQLDSMSHLWCEVAKTGFETSLRVGGSARYVRAVAISADDDVLGASPVLDMRSGEILERYWSHLDLNAQWKEDQDEEDEGDDDWSADYDALKEDWKSMRKAILGVAIGALVMTVVVVAALSWHYRAAWMSLLRWRGSDREGYADIKDEEVSVASFEIPRLEDFRLSGDSDNDSVEGRSRGAEYRWLLSIGVV